MHRDHPYFELSRALGMDGLVDLLEAVLHEVEIVLHVHLREVDHPLT